MALNNPFASLISRAGQTAGRIAGSVSGLVGRSQEEGEEPARLPEPELPSEIEYGDGGHPTRTFLDQTTGMMETTTLGAPILPDSYTIYDLYRERAERLPDSPLFTFRKDGVWTDRSGSEVLEDIRQAAKGFIHLGLKKGDGVAFMCATSYEWNIVDAAVVSIGGVIATIYDTDSPEQMENIVKNSDARLLIVQTEEMQKKAESIKDDCPGLERILTLDTGDLEAVKAYGHAVSDAELDERIDGVHKTDLCSIVYTSGSTAAPKGVELTHEDFCYQAKSLAAYNPQLLSEGSVLLFLPQAHNFARAICYITVNADLHDYISSSIRTLITDLQVARPTIMIGVPRVFEKIYNAASQKAGHGFQGHVFADAAKVARRWTREMGAYGHAHATTNALRRMYDPMVYKPLREFLGGRARWLVCGGAPLDPALFGFFRGAGIPVYEGYGLTETTGPAVFTPIDAPIHPGSCGTAFPGFSVRVSEEGELQIKGIANMARYHKNDAETKRSFTDDGWYRTGDIGTIAPDGFVSVTGRIKDLIITAGGKNVSPEPIQEAIERCPIVENAIVLGDKRPFVSALVTLDPDQLKGWLQAHGLDENMPVEEAAVNAAVRSEVQDYIDKANEGESRAESVRKFIILPDRFTQDNGLLSASLKVIRPKVIRRYARLLDEQMYVPLKKH
jgi:long-chain acyl-CoA synthetase